MKNELLNLCLSSPLYDPKNEERLLYEISVIEQKGFENYFFTLEKAIKSLWENGVWVGRGRGSGCGCYVGYLLGITRTDPIKHNLMFERFLNINREDYPDYDIDVADREQMMEVLKKTFPDKFIVPIGTKGTLGLKSTIQYLFKTFQINYPLPYYEDSRMIYSKLIDDYKATTTEEFFAIPDERIKGLISYCNNNVTGYSLEQMLNMYSSNIKNDGVHAGGILFLGNEEEKRVPLSPTKHKSFSFASSFSESDSIKELEQIGIIKFDMLGSETLKLISTAMNYAKCKESDVNFDDKKVYEFLYTYLHTSNIFQLESDGMTKLVEELKPDNISDLSILIAVYRPGTMQMQVHETIIKAKFDCDYAKSLWDKKLYDVISPIISHTYSHIIYQEQVMEIGKKIGKFEGKDLNDFRKFISSKAMKFANPEKYEQLQHKFYDAFIENGKNQFSLDEEVLETLWNQLEGISAYSFNQSHSTTYAERTFITAWLAYYHPLEWYYSILYQKDIVKNLPIIKRYIKERGLDIKITTPKWELYQKDITLSQHNNQIALGIGNIKGIGQAGASELVGNFRKNVSLTCIDDLKSLLKKKTKKKGQETVSLYDAKAVTSGTLKTLAKIGFFNSVLPEGRNFVLREVFGEDVNYSQLDYAFIEQQILGVNVENIEYIEELEDKVKLLLEENGFEELVSYADFAIINADEYKKKKTKGGKDFLQVYATTANGEELTFNLFEKDIVKLKNIFCEQGDGVQVGSKYGLFFVKNGNFLNVEVILPLK